MKIVSDAIIALKLLNLAITILLIIFVCDYFNQGSIHSKEITPEQLRGADEVCPLTHTIFTNSFFLFRSLLTTQKNVLFLKGHRREEDGRISEQVQMN